MKISFAPRTSPSAGPRAERRAIDQEGAGQHLLDVEHRADLAGDLLLDVVALVEHEGDAARLVQTATPDDLVKDAKELERVGGTDDEIIVGVEAGVEVERPQASESQELGHDELDVRARRVVSGVEADDGTVSECGALHVGRSPVRDVGRVERWLEELVLEHEALVASEAVVDLATGSRPAAPGGP